jgi:hypothetical protein
MTPPLFRPPDDPADPDRLPLLDEPALIEYLADVAHRVIANCPTTCPGAGRCAHTPVPRLYAATRAVLHALREETGQGAP